MLLYFSFSFVRYLTLQNSALSLLNWVVKEISYNYMANAFLKQNSEYISLLNVPRRIICFD